VWRDEELIPFQQLIATYAVPVVMTSHLINTQLDPSGTPATFSKAMITDTLRGDLKFDGVAMTDALEMGAIQALYTLPDTVQKAFACGHDLLCFSFNQAALGKGLPAAHQGNDALIDICTAAVQEALDNGLLTALQLNTSERRLDALKVQLRAYDADFWQGSQADAPSQVSHRVRRG
jgi:beta-N-acetylhexosaminidase